MPSGQKWYAVSSEPLFKILCPVCKKEIVKEYNQKWYYSLNSLLIFFYYMFSIFFYERGESTMLVKAFLIVLIILSIVILIKQSMDYKYVSLIEQDNKKTEQHNKNTKGLIKHAQKHLQNPVHVHDYMDKHQLTYAEVKVLINSGELSAYSGYECRSR